MRHETELPSQRPDGCPVAKDDALGSRTETGAAVLRSTVAARHPVPGPQRLCVAQPAARSTTLPYRVSLFAPLVEGWHLGADSRGAAPSCAAGGEAKAQTVRRGARRPEREDDRTRGATRLRRGKKSSAAIGMWLLTRWGSSGGWSLRPTACRIAAAAVWP